MNISILGTGSMADGLARLLTDAGNRVTLAGRSVEKARSAAAAIGRGVQAASIKDAAAEADIVVLAVPYDAAADVIGEAGGLAGKLVIDITNPMTADFSRLALVV